MSTKKGNKVDIKVLKLQIIMKILRENPVSKMYQNDKGNYENLPNDDQKLIAVLQDLNKQLSPDVTLMFNVDKKRDPGQT